MPTIPRSLLGTRGFSCELDDAVVVDDGDAQVLRVGYPVQQQDAVRIVRRAAKASTWGVRPSRMQVVPRKATNFSPRTKSRAMSDGVGDAPRGVLRDVGHPGPPAAPSPTAAMIGLASHLVSPATIPISCDPGVHQVLDGVEEHRLVRHRHGCLAPGVGQRAQARPLASGEDERLHTVLRVWRGALSVEWRGTSTVCVQPSAPLHRRARVGRRWAAASPVTPRK